MWSSVAAPGSTIKAVTRATYLQLWWPQVSQQAAGELAHDLDAVWSTSWVSASQVDIKGIVSGTPDVCRTGRVRGGAVEWR
jgi:hypothetical protein